MKVRRQLILVILGASVLFLPFPLLAEAQSFNYSTGAVADYKTCNITPDLPHTIKQAENVRGWLNRGGLGNFSRWVNGDVWGSDFRDGTGNNNDLESQGGSDRPHIYYFTGHGSCQNPPLATSGDFLLTCGTFGKPDSTTIGTSSRWGNSGGVARFIFVDASCPMDLVSLSNQWFPVFRGLHLATGHSGDVGHDTLDSDVRGNEFAAYNVGLSVMVLGITIQLIPRLSVSEAWMQDGLTDVQSGVCAVALAAGNDRNDAIDRRENEKIFDNRSNPAPNWFAWKWICS